MTTRLGASLSPLASGSLGGLMGSTHRGDLRLLLLDLLGTRAMTGADLREAISRATDGRYRPSAGSIYPRLSNLVTRGLATRNATKGLRRVEHSLTANGKEELTSRRPDVQRAWQRLLDF
ncbi:PadR family transcriptional regulator [Micromonospora wenchangensis]|uniref:PadR family transcriptional regulator n=1 Tax=Micromonospora wenchangensis TaxID=1185415 RepID=UPI0034259999